MNVRLLSVVDRDVYFAVMGIIGKVDDHEPATADTTGIGTNNAEGERCSHRRIHGVATKREHLSPGRRGDLLIGRNHPAPVEPIWMNDR